MSRRSWKDDGGAFAVMFALIFIALVGFSALAVDVGYWYASKRQLQTAADTAAMAGCQELAHKQSNAKIWATVQDYAGRNFTKPVNLANCSVIAPTASGLSDIGPNYVKVTVSSDSPAFLSRVLGRNRVRIRAQSVARIGYVTGARKLVPWGLPQLRATRVAGSAGGGTEQSFSKIGTGTWVGTLPSGSTGSVLVRAYNDQTLDPAYPNGVPEDAVGAGYLVRIPDDVPIAGIAIARLSGGGEIPGSMMYTSGAGESVVVYVSLNAALPADRTMVVTPANTTMSKVTDTLYRAQFAAGSTSSLQEARTFGIDIKDKNKVTFSVNPAGGYIVRRSTFPVLDVKVSPSCSTSVSSVPSQVTVKLNEYQYGQRYDLKVTGGSAEVGNFMAIDFSTLRHTPYWKHPQDPAEYPGMSNATSASYYPYIAGNGAYDFVGHIGDAVWTQPGGLSGPQTRSSLLTRFGGEPSNFAGWEAAGKPASKRLVVVPIVEKIQQTTGSTPLRITSFATFYVEDVVSQGGDVSVSGLFVEYTAPSFDVVDTPPGPLAIEAVRLSPIGLDF